MKIAHTNDDSELHILVGTVRFRNTESWKVLSKENTSIIT